MDSFLAQHHASSPTKQIISLGAGTDTRYFRLRAQNRHLNVLYHEFDFPTVCAAKRQKVESNIPILEGETLFPQGGNTNPDTPVREWGICSVNGVPELRYICHPLDLRELPKVAFGISLRGLRTDVPTLIISECCLCYLDDTAASGVIQFFANKIDEVGIVLYEPIEPDDPFGQMMTENLAARSITMPTVQNYKTLDQQKERLARLGFRDEDGGGGNDAVSIDHIWDTWVTDGERQRVDLQEGLDEIEEWQMLARHYSVAWGWKGRLSWDSWMKLLNIQ